MMVALLTVGAAIAQQGPRNGNGYGQGNRGNGSFICDNLDLTQDQQTKVDALRTAHFKATQEQRDVLAEKQVKLDDLLNDNPIDQKIIEKLVSEISKIQSELMLSRINHKIEMRSLLNDDQKVKFDMMAGNRGNYGGKGRSGRGQCRY
jgi:Spy/CpxP family protein refolding chaperone